MKKNKKKNNENKSSQNIKKEILSKVNIFFKTYKKNLENKDFLLVYNNKKDLISVRFLKKNFFHLTGLSVGEHSISSYDFYRKLENKTLNINDIEVGKFTEKKLNVSIDMIKIFKGQSRIGKYDPNNIYQKKLLIDNGIGLSIPNSNMVLGIRVLSGKNAVPVSLLQQKLENISQKDTITDIICMFEKNVIEEQYNKIIYNTIDIKNLLQENKELEKLLTVDLLKEILKENKEIEVVDKNEITHPSSLKKENTKETIIVESKKKLKL